MVQLTISGLPQAPAPRVTFYPLDDEHLTAYNVWKSQGSPIYPSPNQVMAMKSASELQALTLDVMWNGSAATVTVPVAANGAAVLVF